MDEKQKIKVKLREDKANTEERRTMITRKVKENTNEKE